MFFARKRAGTSTQGAEREGFAVVVPRTFVFVFQLLSSLMNHSGDRLRGFGFDLAFPTPVPSPLFLSLLLLRPPPSCAVACEATTREDFRQNRILWYHLGLTGYRDRLSSSSLSPVKLVVRAPDIRRKPLVKPTTRCRRHRREEVLAAVG